MNRETLISIINKNGIRFLPVRRCSLCDEYIGYKFVRMCGGMSVDDAIMEILLERMIDIAFEDETV